MPMDHVIQRRLAFTTGLTSSTGSPRNLEFIRCIDVQGAVESQQTQPCKPIDLTFNRDGNMYITDTGNNCIHCMTTGGQYLMSFSSDGVSFMHTVRISTGCENTVRDKSCVEAWELGYYWLYSLQYRKSLQWFPCGYYNTAAVMLYMNLGVFKAKCTMRFLGQYSLTTIRRSMLPDEICRNDGKTAKVLPLGQFKSGRL